MRIEQSLSRSLDDKKGVEKMNEPKDDCLVEFVSDVLLTEFLLMPKHLEKITNKNKRKK